MLVAETCMIRQFFGSLRTAREWESRWGRWILEGLNGPNTV